MCVKYFDFKYLSLRLGYLTIDFNLAIQTLITNNNKENSKLRKLNVLRYYNAPGMGVQVYEWGRKAINPNYLLQALSIYNIGKY